MRVKNCIDAGRQAGSKASEQNTPVPVYAHKRCDYFTAVAAWPARWENADWRDDDDELG